MLKKLKILFDCENYTDLAKILGVSVTAIYAWKEKNKIPPNITGLLTLIKSQQEKMELLIKELDELNIENQF